MRSEHAHAAGDGLGAATPPKPGWRLVLSSLRRRRRSLTQLAGWSVVESLPAAFTGLLVARAIDQGFLAGSFQEGLLWLAALLAVHAAGALANRFTFPLIGRVVDPVRDDLMRSVVTRVVSREGALHATPDSSEVVRITEQVEEVRRVTGVLLNGVRRFVFTLCAVTAGLSALAPSVLVFALPPVAVAVLLFLALLRSLVHRQRSTILRSETVSAATGDALSGARDITAARAWDRAVGAVAEGIRSERRAEIALARAMGVRSAVTAVGSYGPVLLVLAAAPLLLGGDGLTVGAFIGAVTYLSTNVEPVMRLLTEVLGGSGLSFAVTLHRLSEASGDVADGPAGTAAGSAPADAGVSLHDVTFSYGRDSTPVIEGIDLEVADGEHLAVIGPSGIGKSTLASLLAGLVSPDRGEIRLGGQPLHTLSRAQLARRVTLIPQEAYVFAGTLRENLAYLAHDAPEEVLEAAGRIGGIGARLGGLDAAVDPANLSHGERQLIALARAYAAPARLTILDEASCHLDPVTEAQVETAFAQRPGTVVVIAHRISSAARANRLLLLDGSNPLVGTDEELRAASELYADLVGDWSGGGGIDGRVPEAGPLRGS